MSTTTQSKQDGSKSTYEFLSGKLAQVDINRIERELKLLWHSASESGSDDGTLAVTRACAMNLILYSERSDAEVQASAMLDEITVRHPCRAILAICREASEPSIEAWVSARCHLTGSKKDQQICCEQITVRSQGQSTKELASVVLPLLVSDLPVFMWLNSPGFKLEPLRPFLPSIDRLILDSDDFDDNITFFKELQMLIKEQGQARCEDKVIASDLNWNRSLSWREAVALSFEERNGKLSPQDLENIVGVEIKYGLDKAHAQSKTPRLGLINQSLLVVSWLAGRLGWKFDSARQMEGGLIEIKFTAGGGKRPLLVKLTGIPWEHAGTGDIGSIAVEVGAPANTLLRATQPKGMPGIQVVCLKDGAALKPASGSALELYEPLESVIVDREFEMLAADPVFDETVGLVVEILDCLYGASKNS